MSMDMNGHEQRFWMDFTDIQRCIDPHVFSLCWAWMEPYRVRPWVAMSCIAHGTGARKEGRDCAAREHREG